MTFDFDFAPQLIRKKNNDVFFVPADEEKISFVDLWQLLLLLWTPKCVNTSPNKGAYRLNPYQAKV